MSYRYESIQLQVRGGHPLLIRRVYAHFRGMTRMT